MNKRERLEVIKDLVVRFPIDTQEEIVDRLEAMGVHATLVPVHILPDSHAVAPRTGQHGRGRGRTSHPAGVKLRERV